MRTTFTRLAVALAFTAAIPRAGGLFIAPPVSLGSLDHQQQVELSQALNINNPPQRVMFIDPNQKGGIVRIIVREETTSEFSGVVAVVVIGDTVLKMGRRRPTFR